jgi:hypothetical protein
MSGFLAVLTVSFVMTAIFAVSVTALDVQEIKSNWAKRRCDLGVMVTAGLFKPSESPMSATDFAKENFNFCVGKIAEDVLKVAFAPLVGVAKQQAEAQSSFQGPMNNMRGMIQTGMNTFSDIIKEQYQRFSFGMIQFTRIWQHFQFAMGRLNAIMVSFVYIGLSLAATVENTYKFSIKVVMIILGIMIALIILLFFVLLPFIPAIIIPTTIALAGIGAGVAGAGAFCIDPDALVRMADGSTKPLKEVRCGDVLAGFGETPNCVTGVLTTDSKGADLVSIDGITMSGSHRVKRFGTWLLAREVLEKQPAAKRLSQLICLNTTHHEVLLEGTTGHVTVGDWEEVSTPEGQAAWIQFVHHSLNGGHSRALKIPTTPPLVSGLARVYNTSLGSWVPIETIQIGDSIQSGSGCTRVRGVYKGRVSFSSDVSTTEWISEGVWEHLKPGWAPTKHGKEESEGPESIEHEGMFLVTEDGMFVIRTEDHPEMVVRDFTEVGHWNMERSYGFLSYYLNKK